jgi:hypothetical protein
MVGNRRTDAELVALLDAQGTWVVRGSFGVAGNAGSLRVALRIALKKCDDSNPLVSIASVNRLEHDQILIPRRQLLRLLETAE